MLRKAEEQGIDLGESFGWLNGKGLTALTESKVNQTPSSRIFIRIFGQQEIRQLNIRLEHTFIYTKGNHAFWLK